MKACQAIRKDGTPCRGIPGKDGYCIGHRPGAAAARARGGQNSSKRARLARRLDPRLVPICELLAEAIVDCYSGNLRPAALSAMAAAASALTRITESIELEARISALEGKEEMCHWKAESKNWKR